MVSLELIKTEYPLHLLVWYNNYTQLEQELMKIENDKEKRDPRGRTPLLLAVALGHIESVRVLLNYDVNVNCESSDGWTVVQEAVATGDPELIRLVLDRREHQRFTSRTAGIPELLRRLDQAPDFYVEMKWEFTSWVPLISRMCPSDTYRVYKQGANVRIDTTLLGFDHTSWQRGNRSYVFQGQTDGATMMEVDHDTRQVYIERMQVMSPVDEDPDNGASGIGTGCDESVTQRLTSPIVSTFIDTDKISFERNKAGMWGWRSDRSETINNYECKVFSASNVELVTRTRTEHLTETDKAKSRGVPARTPLQSFLGMAETSTTTTTTSTTTVPHTLQNNTNDDTKVTTSNNSINSTTPTPTSTVAPTPIATDINNKSSSMNSISNADNANYEHQHPCNVNNINSQSYNPTSLTIEEYFEPMLNGGQQQNHPNRDIGRPKEITTKIQRFRATLWLSESYPLSLQEQIMPVVDLMAISSTHFAKLRDFVRLQLPAGFPVKVEIPLFHVLNARITFGNVLGLDDPSAAPGVTRVQESDGRVTCIVDDKCFAPPAGYNLMGTDMRRQYSVEEEDDLLQFAIQQSLIEAGTEREEVDIWEALKGQKPNPPSPSTLVGEEERQLQRAIQASLALYQRNFVPNNDSNGSNNLSPSLLPSTEENVVDDNIDADLQVALMLSEQQRREEEEQQLQEQKTLEEILRLSLIDK